MVDQMFIKKDWAINPNYIHNVIIYIYNIHIVYIITVHIYIYILSTIEDYPTTSPL